MHKFAFCQILLRESVRFLTPSDASGRWVLLMIIVKHEKVTKSCRVRQRNRIARAHALKVGVGMSKDAHRPDPHAIAAAMQGP